MGNSEKFCLRWNEFESNISTAFRELRDDQDFFDVTLVCEEEQIQAHKVILSACSPFFRSVLRRNRHEHPLLYLRGIKYIDIVSILTFMYHGEVNVSQEELNSFLSVAEDLKVKGLTQNDPERTAQVNNPSKPHSSKPKATNHSQKQVLPISKSQPRTHQTSSVQQKYKAPAVFPDQEDDIQEVVPIKSEPVSITPSHGRLIPVQSMEQEYVGNTTSQIEALEGDPHMDDTIYSDEYADYSNYEAEQSYEGEALARQNTAASVEGVNGKDHPLCFSNIY